MNRIVLSALTLACFLILAACGTTEKQVAYTPQPRPSFTPASAQGPPEKIQEVSLLRGTIAQRLQELQRSLPVEEFDGEREDITIPIRNECDQLEKTAREILNSGEVVPSSSAAATLEDDINFAQQTRESLGRRARAE